MTVLTAANPLLPPMSVKPSASIQPEDSVFDQLAAVQLPDKEINDILNLHDSLSLQQVIDRFDGIAAKMTAWLQTAQMAVFTLELNVKEESTQSTGDTQSILEFSFGRMEPLVSILDEISTVVLDKLDDDDDDDAPMTPMQLQERRMRTRMSLTKIQSEWSGLQHFFTSVIRQLESINEKRELTTLMEHVLQQIDDLSIMMFQFQEKRHAAAAATCASSVCSSEAMSSPLSTTSSGMFSPSTTSTITTAATLPTVATNMADAAAAAAAAASAPPRDDQILVDIDNRVEPLFHAVQKIYASMTSATPPDDPSGVLTRKHNTVQHRWEALRIEIDDLKEELKEDRWLTVFRQVADQVDVMIDGLEKTVTQCYGIIQQVREWHAAAHPPQQHGNAFDRISRTLLRSLPRPHHSSNNNSTTSSSSSSSHQQQSPSPPVPVDGEKFRSIEKNFEAKYKYYAPSIDKMLGMLGNGIVSRVARDNVTSRRHASMMQRWTALKTTMDDLRARDLRETERMLFGGSLHDRNGVGGGWRGIRYRSPDSANDARSNTLPRMGSNGRFQVDDRRVRSVTPSLAADMRKSMYSPVQRAPPRAASSMANHSPRDYIRPSTSDSSSLDEVPMPRRRLTKTPSRQEVKTPGGKESKSLGTRKSRVPARTATPSGGGGREEASWMKPTKSTIMRNRRSGDSDDGGNSAPARPKTPTSRPKTPTSRPKTPTSSRPKTPTSTSRPKTPTSTSRPKTPTSTSRPKTPTSTSRPKTPTSRPKTPVTRSKTPTPGNEHRKTMTPVPPRPKSSLGSSHQRDHHQRPYHQQPPPIAERRAPSPVRRTMTPSLIPRPKTPQQHQPLYRTQSPALKQQQPRRPRSSMMAMAPPPRPRPLSQVLSDSTDEEDDTGSFLHPDDRRLLLLRKKQSMPAVLHHQPSCSEVYTPNRRDPLDIEVARIVNASPITVKCQKSPVGTGKYFFGNELNPSVGGGKKMYTCKLMNYAERGGSSRRSKAPQNKVLVRVGGGWQDLEMFLLDHSNLMTTTAADIVATTTTRPYSSMGYSHHHHR